VRGKRTGPLLLVLGLTLTGCASEVVDPSLAEHVRPEATELADDALAWPGSVSAPRITLAREDTCTFADDPSGLFDDASGTHCLQQGRAVYALLDAVTSEQALEQAAVALKDSDISPVDPFADSEDLPLLADPAFGVLTAHPASRAYGTDETTIVVATVDAFLDRAYFHSTDVVVSSTAGLEGDELATAISATGAAYVLGIEYNREYFDSRSVGVNKAPRNDQPPCFGTSGYCPGG